MEQTYSTKQIIIIMVVILSVILVFYGITVLVSNNKKEDTKNDNNSDTVIQYEEILVGEIFKQNNSEYYVLAYDSTSDGQKYKSDINTYVTKENSTKTYFVDMTNAFNKKYVSTESNFENEFPIFKEPTLLKIANGSIVEVYEGNSISDKITDLKKE